jgi:cellulose biosynthesis protein BcsQ
MNADPKVISLYSFKGGAGRTVCTANLAGLYAKEINATPENPILLMDMDLDSAGLTILLDQWTKFKGSRWNASRVVTGELDLNILTYYENFYDQGMVDVSGLVGSSPGTVRFIGAEVIGREETVPVMGRAPERMQDLITYCGEKGISTIIIDSASGRQETAHLCHRLSDLIIYCCRLTHQFLTGTELQLKRFVEQCETERGSIPGIILLPVAVPEISEAWEERKKISMARLSGLCNTIAERTYIHLVDEGVGEVESFKWVESVLSTKKALADDEVRALDAFSALTKVINKALS